MKTCCRCGCEKEDHLFGIIKYKNKLTSSCKLCNNAYHRERYPKEKEKKSNYYQQNKQRFKENCKKWRNDNVEYVREYNREKNLRPENKLRKNVSKRIKRLFSYPQSTSKLLGCSGQFLKEYLEAKFVDGMTWDNYGFYGWHMDHIRPIASFDLNNEAEVKECFHYTNLQPLWAKDNLSKGAKF